MEVGFAKQPSWSEIVEWKWFLMLNIVTWFCKEFLLLVLDLLWKCFLMLNILLSRKVNLHEFTINGSLDQPEDTRRSIFFKVSKSNLKPHIKQLWLNI